MANKIRLVVGGLEYCIVSDEEESYVRGVGEELNRLLDQISRRNPYLSTTMVAVLAALDLCDEQKKAENEVDALRMQMKQYSEEAACARLEADEARREIDRLNRENQALRNRTAKA